MKEQNYGTVRLRVLGNREDMGRAAAASAAAALRRLLAAKDEVNAIFAAAPSQNEALQCLMAEPDIDWKRVNGFHMDEYVGLPLGHPQSFNAFLTRALFSRLPFKSVNLMNGMAEPAAECERYAALLRAHPADLIIMGIGENGHIAFNDPPVADFHDPSLVKLVELDDACRQQQVNDGCFPDFAAVPQRAITLTVPALVAAENIVCIVPGIRKAQALRDALTGPKDIACPASILRQSPGVEMFADAEAASLLE